ncbi:MAG TPA: DUF4214 domain-containing protein [Pyrinomonadaceae bacterium]|jgi:hypothetical protein
MTRTTSILLTTILLAVVTAGGFGSRAQAPKAAGRDGDAAPAAWRGFAPKQHPQARIGSTPERRAAWERLTPAEQQKVRERFQQILEGAMQKAQKERRADAEEPTDTTAVVSGKDGMRRSLKAKAGKKAGSLTLVAPGQGATRAGRAPGGGRGSGVMFVRAAARDFAAASPATRAAVRPAAYLRAQAGCWKTIEQFVRDFYQAGLVRQPSPYELNYWVSSLTYAQAQGPSEMVVAARNLGYAVFRSQEYAARGRADVDFVYDLYKGWLQREPEQPGWGSWVLTLQNYSRDVVIDGFAYSTEFQSYKVPSVCDAASTDSDLDGLPDLFESRVGDAFTPVYHVSAGDPDNFSTFADSVQQTVAQRFGQSAISHFRVQPLGFAYDTGTGQLVSVLRLDYLALLDHDSGLVNGFFCSGISSFGIPVGGLGAHDIDNERSAVLVAAPVSDYTFNLDPAAYGAYTYMTVSHEDKTFFEHKTFIDFYPPLPAGGHLHLWQSLSKHGTYHFDPDYLPIVDPFIIYSVFDEIQRLYDWGYIDIYQYFSLYFQADTFFYACAVERFSEQGGQFAFLRINVGEPDAPMNGSRFIGAGALRGKLLRPFFQ